MAVPETPTWRLANDAYDLTVSLPDGQVRVRLHDKRLGCTIADGPYVYRAARAAPDGLALSTRLLNAAVRAEGDTLLITGQLAGLALEHRLTLPAGRPILEERLRLRNPAAERAALEQFACGFQRPITTDLAVLLPGRQDDRLVSIPFRHRITGAGGLNEFSLAQLLSQPGQEARVNDLAPIEYGYVPAMQRSADGWAWLHDGHALGIFAFCQEAMVFSVLGVEVSAGGVSLRFGGASLVNGEPAALGRMAPGQVVDLGVTRLETLPGDWQSAAYAFRDFLDEHGCRFPPGFDPPVHWNELYDNPEWNVGSPGLSPANQMTRPLTYTRALLLDEARKARDYSCEALYLDPGWDTDFGTFHWGEAWLGDSADFVRTVRDDYGLSLSLHCPLATWMSRDGRATASWPEAARRRGPDGQPIIWEGWSGRRAPSVCLGASQYLDEAERRLLALCAAGVTFLMFDGNWWNGGCWNAEHGHPVPYTLEDHVQANLELCRRIHARYPNVIIEMHDMISGGSSMRYTPVSYKYGLPGSYDENWGFELMWAPMEDIRSGRAAALYDYNLACNVPIYLHVDLRCDNDRALVLWWFASTCRHLGIGGTHEDPLTAQRHRHAMARYRRLERFYKRGDFYGYGEEIHVHALPDENAFVVNLFNLSDESRIITGVIDMGAMGLDLNRWYVTPYTLTGRGFDRNAGTYTASRRLEPWSAQVMEVTSLPD